MIKKLFKVAFSDIYPIGSTSKDSIKTIIKKIGKQALARCLLLFLLAVILQIFSNITKGF